MAKKVFRMFTETLQRQKPEKKTEEQPEPVLDAMANRESHAGEGCSLATSCNFFFFYPADLPLQNKFSDLVADDGEKILYITADTELYQRQEEVASDGTERFPSQEDGWPVNQLAV
ncbi:hypothetical protein GRJ2_001297900 [Grus japonensis]|uniref:Uncharacterized protein n=1 Tax=Grus japonensis TaxID=30415 RepID=A0ABC9WSR7_GRUJA